MRGRTFHGLTPRHYLPMMAAGLSEDSSMPMVDFDLACARCGTNLRGVGLDETCPQCDRLVGQTLNLTVIDTASMTVCDDVECVSCQYNMRTLAVASVCPECGKPVSASLRTEDLRFADPAWLRSVHGGMAIAAAACIGLALLPLLTLGGLIRTVGFFQVFHYARVGLTLLWCLGIWRAARSALTGTANLRDVRLGSWVRRSVFVIVVVLLLHEAHAVTVQWSRPGAVCRLGVVDPRVFTWVDMVFFWALTALGQAVEAASVVLLVLLLRRLARRGHRHGRYFGLLAWAAMAVGAACVLTSFPLNYVWMRLRLGPQASPSALNNLLSTIMPVLMRWTQYAWMSIELLVAVALLRSCSMLRRVLAKRPA